MRHQGPKVVDTRHGCYHRRPEVVEPGLLLDAFRPGVLRTLWGHETPCWRPTDARVGL